MIEAYFRIRTLVPVGRKVAQVVCHQGNNVTVVTVTEAVGTEVTGECALK